MDNVGLKVQQYKGKVKDKNFYVEGYALATKHSIFIGTTPYIHEEDTSVLCLDHWYEVDPSTVEEI